MPDTPAGQTSADAEVMSLGTEGEAEVGPLATLAPLSQWLLCECDYSVVATTELVELRVDVSSAAIIDWYKFMRWGRCHWHVRCCGLCCPSKVLRE